MIVVLSNSDVPSKRILFKRKLEENFLHLVFTLTNGELYQGQELEMNYK